MLFKKIKGKERSQEQWEEEHVLMGPNNNLANTL